MRFFKIAAAFAFMVATPSMALAQTSQGGNGPGNSGAPPILGTVLSFSAEGLATGKPDLATVSLGVTTEGANAAAAMQENSQHMNGLMAALRRAGVAERDIQTSNVSVNPQQQFRENEPPRITGYQANNQVTAKVRNLDSLGRVIDAAVNAGGNTVNGVSFSYQNPDAQLDAARRDAMTKARRMADLYAQSLNMHVFRVLSVSEGGGYSPPMPVMFAARGMVADGAPAPPPVAPGEIETRVNVSVTYELR